jgi:hypothetical protein
MTVEDTIRSILNVHGRISLYRNTYSMDMHSSEITYDQLAKLSEALGTRKIDLDYCEGDSGYSEYTPGYPGRLTLAVTIDPS